MVFDPQSIIFDTGFDPLFGNNDTWFIKNLRNRRNTKISIFDRFGKLVYQFNEKQNGWNTEAPTWNFCKYLVNEKGELVK